MAMKIVALILAAGIAACAPAFEDCSITGDYCRVTFKGQAVQPSFGSVAGFWFWSCGDAQLLLLGFEGKPGWKGVICGAGWELNGSPLSEGSRVFAQPLVPVRAPFDAGPVAGSPPLASAIADALVEWDWRLQDGIGTPRGPRTFAEAVVPLRARFRKAGLGTPPKKTADETEWRALHQVLRAHALKCLAGKKILFGKFVPGAMSHQLTQCLGHRARPGGGLFVLDDPATMRPREVTPPNLPPGNFLNPELSPDATKILFSYSPVESGHDSAYSGGRPQPCSYTRMPVEVTNVYNIYEAPLAGGPARRLTSDGFDDLFPVYLPGGDIVFSSTRRGGYHRCGRGPCPVFTLARMGPNGENPHSISFHETHEWTPALLPDGRLLYTRWDYVDRNAVLYQQLWTARPDGGGVRIYYGNNTWNPCGTWEARPVPNSTKVMAIAGPPHARGALPGIGGAARTCAAEAGGNRLRLRAEEVLGGRHPGPEPEQDSDRPGEAVAGAHVQVAVAAFRDDVPRLLFVRPSVGRTWRQYAEPVRHLPVRRGRRTRAHLPRSAHLVALGASRRAVHVAATRALVHR